MVKATKKQTKPKKTEKRLEKVPAEYVFWSRDGRIFSDLFDLAEGLAAMTDETYIYHSNAEKHDFANWVRDVIGDIELADSLACTMDRLEAANCVTGRILILTGK